METVPAAALVVIEPALAFGVLVALLDDVGKGERHHLHQADSTNGAKRVGIAFALLLDERQEEIVVQRVTYNSPVT